MTRASSLQTQTAVFEGESIMLAGYLRDIEEDAGWGIPYLRDIPWIGWLFGGKSTKNETVQRMFILTPHVVDLDTEMLARLQATRLRDVAEAEELEDDAEESDNARRRRDLERKYRRERRSDQEADTLERREAELKHGKAMRQVDRERVRISLSEAIRLWEEEEKAEAAKLREEVEEAKRKEAEEVKRKDTE